MSSRGAADRDLAILLAGARLGCAVGIVLGAVFLVGAVGYEALVAHLRGMPNLFVIATGVVPGGWGLYTMVRALLRARTLGRAARAVEAPAMVELAMRFGRPALRVTFADGASETFATGRLDRNALIDALHRRGVARNAPTARVVSK